MSLPLHAESTPTVNPHLIFRKPTIA